MIHIFCNICVETGTTSRFLRICVPTFCMVLWACKTVSLQVWACTYLYVYIRCDSQQQINV